MLSTEHPATELIAAVSLVPRDDWDALDCWTGDRSCTLSRLCVKPQLQKMHLAERVMEEVSRVAKARGYRSTRHGCLVTNVAGNRLYQRMGYADRGKAVIYGHEYRCFERIL